MKKSKLKHQLWTALAVGLAATGAQATILQNWQFNDAAGTPAKNAVNTGSPGDVVFDKWGASNVVNGAGQAVYTTTGTAAEYGKGSPWNITTGKVYIRVDFTSWSFTTNGIVANYTFGFNGNLVQDGVMNKALLNCSMSKNAGDVMRVSTFTTGGASKYSNPHLPAVNSTTPYSVILEVDLDAKTYSVWTDKGITGTYVQTLTATAFPATFTPTSLRFVGQSGSIGDQVAVDMIVVGTDLTEIQTISGTFILG